MKINTIAVTAVTAVALALAGCSGTGQETPGASQEVGDLSYAVVTHSAAGDAFWDRVKSGAEQAGQDYAVTVSYASDPDPAKQAALIDGAVADKVDGIVVSMANPDGLEASIRAAVKAGVPVVTINSGYDAWKDFGAITHVGQSELIAGEGVGRKLVDAGHDKVLCVIQEAGNIALEERCQGVAKAGTTVENLQVDGTDDNAVTATITSKLQSDDTIDAVVTLAGQVALDAVAAVDQAGTETPIATFDLNEDVVNAILGGSIEFAVDQQPYVQGYLGVTALYLKSINGNDIGGGQAINSGPAFVTKENAEAVLQFAKNGTR